MIFILLIPIIIILVLVWYFLLKQDGSFTNWESDECPICSDTDVEANFSRKYIEPSWFGSVPEDYNKLTKVDKCQVRPCAAKGRYIRIEQKNKSGSDKYPLIQLGWIKVYTKDSSGKDVLISKDKPIVVSSVLRNEVKNFSPQFLHVYEKMPNKDNMWGGIYHSNGSADAKNKVTPFIELDLGEEHVISKIEVGNRFNKHRHDRIDKADVFILREDKTPDWKGKFKGSKEVYNFEGLKAQL
jgi:hypothetical protein